MLRTAIFLAAFSGLVSAENSLEATIEFGEGCIASCDGLITSDVDELVACFGSVRSAVGVECETARISFLYTLNQGLERCTEKIRHQPVEGLPLGAILGVARKIGAPLSTQLLEVDIEYDVAVEKCLEARIYALDSADACQAAGNALEMIAVVFRKDVIFARTATAGSVTLPLNTTNLAIDFSAARDCSVGESKKASVKLEAIFPISASPLLIEDAKAESENAHCLIESCQQVTNTASVAACVKDASEDATCKNIIYTRTYRNLAEDTGRRHHVGEASFDMAIDMHGIIVDDATLEYGDKTFIVTDLSFGRRPQASCRDARLQLSKGCCDRDGFESTLEQDAHDRAHFTGEQKLNVSSAKTSFGISHPLQCVYDGNPDGPKVTVKTVIPLPQPSSSTGLVDDSLLGLLPLTIFPLGAP